jgi:hypothetical protein
MHMASEPPKPTTLGVSGPSSEELARREESMREARASVELEGCKIHQAFEEDLLRLTRGEVTADELVEALRAFEGRAPADFKFIRDEANER